ncbi:ABC transporter substrate-binding protein [Pseudidiomarina halophila]|uniref:ABC transporter substrate-binding protein n=1 Tax=Pseudidiomarina halophila TaxID=1449799 RepID=UPI00130081CD|nr:ABC transporter substrate-binding protein [Pseudidiomarina halophila]
MSFTLSLTLLLKESPLNCWLFSKAALSRLLLGLVLCGLPLTVSASAAAPESEAPEQEVVYFYAWGGSESVNAYLRWVQQQLAAEEGIRLQHVKVADIGEAVALLLAERTPAASKIDLLWINGENFQVLKEADKLLTGLPAKVPNTSLLRDDLNWQTDFGVAVDGQELPWGIAQFQLVVRDALLTDIGADSMLTTKQFLQLAKNFPGRLSYPKPPSFHGTSWLKALAYELVDQPQLLQRDPKTVSIEQVLAPLWRYLDQLHPHLWRQGREFPGSAAQQRQWLNHGTLDNAVTFNPNEIPALQQQLRLTPAARAVSLGTTALTNFHYLAIPRASAQHPAALKVINFLLSEKAQQRKAALDGWGDPMVIKPSTATTDVTLFPSHPEPHVQWTAVLEQAWLQRYQR